MIFVEIKSSCEIATKLSHWLIQFLCCAPVNRVPVLSRLPACELNKATDRQPSYRPYNNIFFTNLAHFFICLYFTNLITFLLLLFVFILLKHNKLQMIYWGYHNCYGNLELSIDLWSKAKHGFIVNTAPDEEKKTLERLGLREQRLISDINILKT